MTKQVLIYEACRLRLRRKVSHGSLVGSLRAPAVRRHPARGFAPSYSGMRPLPISLLFVALLGSRPGGQAWAQAHAGCPAKPTTLGAMRGCYRPLLVLAPSAEDPRVRQQQHLLDEAADDLMDRNVLYVPVPAATADAHWQPPLDAPYAMLPAGELAGLRKRFHATADGFAVLLLGEDGGVKLQSRKPVSVDRLNSLIDTMPTRKREMQQPHSN